MSSTATTTTATANLFDDINIDIDHIDIPVNKDDDDEDDEEFMRIDPDPDMFDLINYHPWILEERAKYDDNAVLCYVKKHPRSVRALYQFKKQLRGTFNTFPLNRIISLGASLQTIKNVFKAHPSALYEQDSLRRTSLHSACNYPTDHQEQVIKFLLTHSPESIQRTNKNAFLPIHNACSATAPCTTTLPVIQLLIEAHPRAISQINKLGETPLKTAQRNLNCRVSAIIN